MSALYVQLVEFDPATGGVVIIVGDEPPEPPSSLDWFALTMARWRCPKASSVAGPWLPVPGCAVRGGWDA
jgi:hypothetical protein